MPNSATGTDPDDNQEWPGPENELRLHSHRGRLTAEREAIATELAALLARPAGGSDGNGSNRQGVLAIINGAATMGKTALLDAVIGRADGAEVEVLRAAGSRSERQMPYAVLTQILDVRGLGIDTEPRWPAPDQREAEVDLMRAVQRVHQAIQEITRTGRTVLIAIDDVQHADVESVHCLHYLARRATSLPVMILLTCGNRQNEVIPPVLQEILYSSRAHSVHLGPLPGSGVAEVLAERIGCAITPTLVAQYEQISGGNPLLLEALCDDSRSHSCTAGSIDCCVPQPREGFRRAVLTCVHRMGPRATAIARGAAVLGAPTSVSQLGRLSTFGAGLTAGMVRALESIGVLSACAFGHPAARAAVLDDIAAEDAVQLHYRAARILYAEGASPQRAAEHIRLAGPLTEDWAVSVLRDAARLAIAAHRPEPAAGYLELAVECCEQPDQQLAILMELALAYRQVRPAASIQHHLSLRTPVLTDRLTCAQGLQVVDGLLWHLRVDEAQELVEHLAGDPRAAASALTDPAAPGRFLHLRAGFPGLVADLEPMFPEATAQVPPSEALGLRAARALSAVLSGTADDHVVAQAEQVLRSADLARDSMSVTFPALLCLIYTDRLEAAAEWAASLLAATNVVDAPVSWACAATYSALIAFRRGALDVAIEQAEAALALAGNRAEPDWFMEIGLALAVLVEAHTAVGNLQAAATHLARSVPQALFRTRIGLHYLYARGRHQLARGRRHTALADFMSCGERMVEWGIDHPAVVPWRVAAAETWLGLEDRAKAAALLTEQLTGLAHAPGTDPGSGLDRTRGLVLRACAAAEADVNRRPRLLNEALERLQACGDRFETARVLAELSGVYRAMGAREQAKAAERRACRIGKSCHPEALRQLLPAVSSISGNGDATWADLDSLGKLSASERPVAVLAAQGHTNREISSKLFITISTVEQHLTRIYRKMDIRSREELSSELSLDAVESSPR